MDKLNPRSLTAASSSSAISISIKSTKASSSFGKKKRKRDLSSDYEINIYVKVGFKRIVDKKACDVHKEIRAEIKNNKNSNVKYRPEIDGSKKDFYCSQILKRRRSE